MNNRITRAASIFDFNFRAVHLAQARLQYTAKLYAKLAQIPHDQTTPGARAIAMRSVVMVQIDALIEQAAAAGNGEAVRPLRDLHHALGELQTGVISPLLRTSDGRPAEAGTGENRTVSSVCTTRKHAIGAAIYRP
jgi:hypothetical protein